MQGFRVPLQILVFLTAYDVSQTIGGSGSYKEVQFYDERVRDVMMKDPFG